MRMWNRLQRPGPQAYNIRSIVAAAHRRCGGVTLWSDRLSGHLRGSPLVAAARGERSFAVTTEQIENLPINHGNFTSLTQLTPGVQNGGNSAGATRIGGAGQNNIMMDGISAMDTGNNGQMIAMNIES